MYKIIMIFLALTGLSGCDQPQQSTASKLRVGMCADNPPMEFYRNGVSVGFDVDFAKKLGEVLGREVEIQDMDFGGLIPALQSGRIDMVISDLSATPERQKSVDFSIIYHQGGVAILSRQDAPLVRIDDLANKTVAVQLGSVWEKFAQDQAKEIAGLKIFAGNRLGLLVEDLKTGRVDAVLLEAATARQFAVQNPQLVVNVLSNHSSGAGVALSKGSSLTPQVNQAIEHLQKTGWMLEAERKWFQGDMRQGS